MKIKLIASDMDGTLLNDRSELTDRTVRALMMAAERGVYFVLASGRMARAMRPYAERLPMNAPIIADNGALIYDLRTDETLFKITLDEPDVLSVLRETEAMGLYVQSYIGDDYYFEREAEYSRSYARSVHVEGKCAGTKLSRFKTDEVLKLLIVDEPARIEKIRPQFIEKFGDKMNVAVSRPHFLEFTHKQAEKGLALKMLAEMLGVDRAQIAAFGDAQNDLSMIAYAGIGCAVRSARPEVLEAADEVVPGNGEDGVAQWIEERILA